MRILVTGATGYVGLRLCEILAQQLECQVFGVSRTLPHNNGLFKQFAVLDIVSQSIPDYLLQVEVMIHLAARVHIMHDKAESPLAEFRKVNVEGTAKLAYQAAAAGVKRFIFLSSIKVNGEETKENPYLEKNTPLPIDPYGMSKWEAEQVLRKIETETGMEVVIIRPPLIYGAGVKANFKKLIQTVDQGTPLPLGLVNNRRSFIGLHNLIDFIRLCMTHPKAAGETFLISDGDDMRTPELIRRIAKSLNKPARLLPVPVWVIRYGAALLGRKSMVDRLLACLQVDSSKARNLLDWQPVMSVQKELDLTVQDYLKH